MEIGWHHSMQSIPFCSSTPPPTSHTRSNFFHRVRQWHPTPVLLPRKSHGRRSLVGCSPWGRQESDMTERLHVHFSLSCTGEGNGNPLQCSCLENPRDGMLGWLLSMGSHRVGHDWSDAAAAKVVQCYKREGYLACMDVCVLSRFSRVRLLWLNGP